MMINGKACGGKRALWKWQQNPTDEKTTVIENGFHANQIFFFIFHLIVSFSSTFLEATTSNLTCYIQKCIPNSIVCQKESPLRSQTENGCFCRMLCEDDVFTKFFFSFFMWCIYSILLESATTLSPAGYSSTLCALISSL